jgi:hypothetical protein
MISVVDVGFGSLTIEGDFCCHAECVVNDSQGVLIRT